MSGNRLTKSVLTRLIGKDLALLYILNVTLLNVTLLNVTSVLLFSD